MGGARKGEENKLIFGIFLFEKKQRDRSVKLKAGRRGIIDRVTVFIWRGGGAYGSREGYCSVEGRSVECTSDEFDETFGVLKNK